MIKVNLLDSVTDRAKGVALVEEKFVRFERAGRHGAAGVGQAAGRGGEAHGQENEHGCVFHSVSTNHLYSAVSPSSSVTVGLKPRSVCASEVSA